MKKTYIRTTDVFNYSNKELENKHLETCKKVAKKCRLNVLEKLTQDGNSMELDIRGPKWNFVKYYLLTINNTEDGLRIENFKRIIDILK